MTSKKDYVRVVKRTRGSGDFSYEPQFYCKGNKRWRYMEYSDYDSSDLDSCIRACDDYYNRLTISEEIVW